MSLINNLNIMIWDKKFAINIVYDCYSGEKITRNQIKAFERFCDNLQWLENAKNEVLKYCKNDVNNDFNNLKKDNIFRCNTWICVRFAGVCTDCRFFYRCFFVCSEA